MLQRILFQALLLCAPTLYAETDVTAKPDTVQIPAIATALRQSSPPPLSPEIHRDHTITFRLYAPAATVVYLSGDWDDKPRNLTKNTDGLWSLTLEPLAAGTYAYTFHLDDLALADPGNPALKPMRTPNTSILLIPGPTAVPIEYRPSIAHGTVHLHDYASQALGITRRLRVYTPPDYDATAKRRYPILYLLHGAGDNEATWTEFGRAHLILDNLIADGKAQPMIMVMTDGHALVNHSTETRAKNVTAFEQDLLGDVLPLVETRYRVLADREHRAIAGLSMGGNQALLIGLNHRDRFAWIAGMSSAVREPKQPLTSFWASPVSTKYPLRLLWMKIGRDDFLLLENRRFTAMLDEKKVPHEYSESEGGHTWHIWRAYFAELAPKLFRTH